MAKPARVGEIAGIIRTPDDARQFLGNALVLLHAAYDCVNTYQGTALTSSILAASTPLLSVVVHAGADGPEAQGREYLDGIRGRAESDYYALPSSGEPLPDATARQVAFDIASIESATGLVMDLFHRSALEDLWEEIKDAATPDPSGWPWYIWAAILTAVAVFALKVRD